jgi:hypothetical protein
MTQQQLPLIDSSPPQPPPATEVASRMGRLLGAWRARRAAPPAPAMFAFPQSDTDDEQPPVEWALRMMM